MRGVWDACEGDNRVHLQELVAEKLATHDGEYFLFAHLNPLPRAEQPFEAYRDATIDAMTLRLGVALMDRLRRPIDLRLIDPGSWKVGFTDVDDHDDASRRIRDEAFLHLQSYREDYLSSIRWRDYLAALDHPGRWLELGRDHEREGWLIEANLCFAAARWLDPAVESAIATTTAARNPRLPRCILDQPSAEYPAVRFADRHWRAWAMRNCCDLPTLLRWECDRNFSIRARIYRSLGQRPHPAAIQALQEGTHDPHPFARAQAVRSLGWCADPTGVEHLQRLAIDDPHPEVRRTAATAVERIVGFWMFYGQWNTIAADPRKLLSVAHQLAELGLRIFAMEVAVRLGKAIHSGTSGLDALVDALKKDQPVPGFDERERHYSHWFADARVSEEAGDPEIPVETAMCTANAIGAPGFEARRILRRLGIGTCDQRRAAPPTALHHWGRQDGHSSSSSA